MTVTKLITGRLLEFVALTAAMFPLPCEAKPIPVFVFDQAKFVEGIIPVKATAVVGVLLHST